MFVQDLAAILPFRNDKIADTACATSSKRRIIDESLKIRGLYEEKYLYLLLRVLVYLLVLGAILYGLYESPYNPHPHSAEDIRRWVVGFGVWAPLIYVAVYTIRPLLLFPTLLLNLSAGVLFGPWWGILFLLLGGFGCASFCYLLGRFGGGCWLLRNFGGSWGERLTNYLVGSGSFKR